MHFNDFYILSKKFPLLFCEFLYILFKDTLICSVGHMNCSLWQYIYVTDRKNLRPNLERSVGTTTTVSTKQTMPNPIVTIEMENGDIIKAELYPDIAPNSVKNFIILRNCFESVYCTFCTFTKNIVVFTDLFNNFCTLTDSNKTAPAFTVLSTISVS